jgi:hypothetical protein
MKKFFLLLAAITMIIAISCEEKIDIEKEKAAVKDVINGETDAWMHQDTAKTFSYYLKDSYQTRVQVSKDTFLIARGWNDIHSRFAKASWAGVTNFKYVKDFVEIKIMEESAWAIYKETQTYEFNGVPKKYDMVLMMVLEKVDEKWLISSFYISDVTPPEPAPAPAAEVKK